MTSIADILAESSTDASGTSLLKQHIKNMVDGLTDREKAILDPWQLPSSERNALYRRLDPTVMEAGPLQIHTFEGDSIVSLNDWIIRGVKGELYPCRSDIFDMTYEAVPDIGDVLASIEHNTEDELEAAMSSLTVMDISDAVVMNGSNRNEAILKKALAAAGCTDVDDWLRVFSKMIAPEIVPLWAPLLQTSPDDCIS